MTKPCTSCGQKAKIVAPEAQELAYYATSSTITSLRGETLSIQQPLIDGFKSPRGGWRAQFRVNGLDYKFTGSQALVTFKQAKDIFAKNGIRVRDVDIWLNLNLQWFDRIDDKYKRVRHAALLEIASTSESTAKTVNPDKRQYTPAQWGKHAWNFLGAYLAQDEYAWSDYRIILEMVRSMLNPSINPSIGCAECYREFSKETDRLASNPLNDREEARKWLVDFHNSVNVRINKPKVSYDSAAKNYLWV